MKDLTKIKTPFGLLGKKTRKALRAHGGPYEFYSGGKWRSGENPTWHETYAYRVKPADPIAVLSDMQESVFKSVLGYAAISERVSAASSIAAAPAIFAAVKEWQEAREARYVDGAAEEADDAYVNACTALAAIVVPA